MKLLEHVQLTGTIRLKTGLHIGTGQEVEKGEALPVMRSQRTGLPYIPGSSIKGKLRYLLEITYGRKKVERRDKGSPCCCGKCQICILFGSGSTREIFEPTRLIFRDCYLTTEFEEGFEEIGLEEKPGIRVDRETGTVSRGALFSIHRVPEGFEFSLEICARIFEKDEENENWKDNKEAIKNWVTMGLFLIEQDALGGSGTRGSGFVEFDNIKFDGKEFEKDWRDKCKKSKDKLSEVEIKRE